MTTKPWLTGLLLCGLLAVTLLIWSNRQSAAAPDVTFTTISGKKIILRELHGMPVVVTFWATDCRSCIEEIPHLLELYHSYHAQGLQMIAVNRYYDPPNHVVEMTKARQLPYDVALDLRNEHALAFGNIQLTPTTFLINPEGLIARQITGVFDLQEMKIIINKMLKG